MFEKIGRLAEKAATDISVSRRGFLGRLGQAALAAAGALGGLLLFPRDALAGRGVVCCHYICDGRGYRDHFKTTCQAAGTTCDTSVGSCSLVTSSTAVKCSDC
jgi:hypothetical protein